MERETTRPADPSRRPGQKSANEPLDQRDRPEADPVPQAARQSGGNQQESAACERPGAGVDFTHSAED